MEALHASLEAVFNGVLVHRFRDVFAPIRAEVMRYLGEWVLEYPQHFLQNKYGACLFVPDRLVTFVLLRQVLEVHRLVAERSRRCGALVVAGGHVDAVAQ